jgi:hypothetical protein
MAVLINYDHTMVNKIGIPTTSKKELNLMPQLPRIEEMDRVGVEPTTLAQQLLSLAFHKLLSKGSY